MKGFTLIEVELSLFVIAMGALAVVGLYPLGFRESAAAREELVALAAAESMMSRAVSALTDTNLTWSAWREIAENGTLPEHADVYADVAPGLKKRLTVTEGASARLCVGVRVASRVALLDSAPLFYTEVRFQGRPE